jgi:hypothetical protein
MAGEQIFDTLDFPNCKVVLFDWSSNKQYRFENLVCLNDDGSLRWKAALPSRSGPDCFVAIRIDDGQLRASTMSCFAVCLDLGTGDTSNAVFTK